jgi:hypothetical protein
MAPKYTALTTDQIAALKQNGCTAADWARVQVAPGFDPQRVAQVTFAGEVQVGALAGDLEGPDGVARPCGIYNARLRDVTLGDNCAVSGVHGWISNTDIGERVLIENVGRIGCSGKTTCGNGHEVAVLNEGGGRELKITRRTSAQNAYLTVLYRDNRALVAALNAMADAYAATQARTRVFIGAGSRILNVTEMIDVYVGEQAVIDGAMTLKDGTVDSTAEAPTMVGRGVNAEHFIFQTGSSVKDGAMIFSSLVGEGARIGKHFSAENSVFFANSEGFHSEVCSVFAGPYTVTHHHSTLLIAGMFSFYNAGSGTNQSNHRYKLGPVHQGVLERGCKTGSSSYLLWPARVGAFTVVIGKHYTAFDTSDMPFSYIREVQGDSVLTPAINFFTAGTVRDVEKWPARDRRTQAHKLDLVMFPALSPYTVQKIFRGMAALTELDRAADLEQEYVVHKGIKIRRPVLRTWHTYYQLAVDKYIGDTLYRRVQTVGATRLRDVLKPASQAVTGLSEWVDMSGLLCAQPRLDVLVAAVTNGTVKNLEQLQTALETIQGAYADDEWNWLLAAYQKIYGRDLSIEPPAALARLIDQWHESSIRVLDMVGNDAEKEFGPQSRTGFGVDGRPDADFEAVRGTFAEDAFVKKLRAGKDAVAREAAQLKAML